jgi:hypothetical protein
MLPEAKPIPTTSMAGDWFNAVTAEPGSCAEGSESNFDASNLYIQVLRENQKRRSTIFACTHSDRIFHNCRFPWLLEIRTLLT